MRDRLLLPLFIPLGAVAAIFLLIFSVSRILLVVREDVSPGAATTLAIIGAASVLTLCTLLAVGPPLSRQMVYMLTALPASVVIAIGLYLAVRPGEHAGEPGAGPAVVTAFTQVATDNKFSLTEIRVPAGVEVTMTVENRGAALHNMHVLNVKDKSGADITTKLVGGGITETVKFVIEQPGSYPFICDAHPQEMKGTLTVVAEAPPVAGPPAGTPEGIVIIATDNKFDKTSLTVKANEEVTLTLVNRGVAIHNFHVLNVKDKSGKEITTQLLTGGKSETIKFVIEKPGTYDYLCDVHPVEMRGKLTVQ